MTATSTAAPAAAVRRRGRPDGLLLGLLALAFAGCTLDAVTTAVALRFGHGVEANPIVRAGINGAGLAVALLLSLVVRWWVLAALAAAAVRWPFARVGVCAVVLLAGSVWLGAALNNLGVIV